MVAATRLDRTDLERRARALAAAGDPVRLAMLTLLARHRALCVCEIQAAFPLGQPTVSHHLRVLREAGVVDVVRRGRWAYYSVRRDALADLARGMLALTRSEV
ncbi:MAG: metalloregulator ArsR/SmtB family transcription factor [Armatimonadota bacterium]|nr:metalloregulator ArsR/SmtB family transcription factor [Armatimonadota bacterium]MDR7402813.1 metalloregulator ArsR/SmtB family transcription factor [Armatimonadota bacterium]MDR7405012.1 metalloregulator ArsR/SmtB family transcription factor [Armatimonadota bacterium]MDR7436151.1 metalloregulator ArsR/SmtB family transcription factor [Armatimonadota bacterium]MDR7472030.1 metalloregulator ArsR/SmtB family transcription factor [Armatimonadota bacterium]